VNNNYPYDNMPSQNNYIEEQQQNRTHDFQNERQFPWTPGGPSHTGPFPGFPSGPNQPANPGQSAQPPSEPPPNFTPQQAQIQPFAVDSGAIRGCLFRFTYIWLRREAFWFFPTFVGRRSISGFRWVGFRWVYFGIDLRRIDSFQCF